MAKNGQKRMFFHVSENQIFWIFSIMKHFLLEYRVGVVIFLTKASQPLVLHPRQAQDKPRASCSEANHEILGP